MRIFRRAGKTFTRVHSQHEKFAFAFLDASLKCI
jgi:hypothetical protein